VTVSLSQSLASATSAAASAWAVAVSMIGTGLSSGFHEHAEFGAGQDDDLGAAGHQVGDRSLELGPGDGQEAAFG
jgi:hypothetical protein